ncbi:MAG: TIGR00266 family protein [Oscillospiraceae bacterium]|jgi:uncharacterized protein (TIGR00266 family)|nr:TIGR00266 family protein [Oscillospiraceae bacterium]
MQYKIEGEPLPVLTCELAPNESMVTERGGMSWMSPNMEMQTNMKGGLGKALGRMFSGESIFMNIYTCRSAPGTISFASSLPGTILDFDISPMNTIIAQKSAFLAAESSVELSVHFNKKIAGGFFGGEGFIMQKLSGAGKAFLEIDGYCLKYYLQPGQSIIVGTGHLAAMEATVKMDVQMVHGMKNMVFGGEGLFNTHLTGPGHVWLQSMPVANLASSILAFQATKS